MFSTTPWIIELQPEAIAPLILSSNPEQFIPPYIFFLSLQRTDYGRQSIFQLGHFSWRDLFWSFAKIGSKSKSTVLGVRESNVFTYLGKPIIHLRPEVLYAKWKKRQKSGDGRVVILHWTSSCLHFIRFLTVQIIKPTTPLHMGFRYNSGLTTQRYQWMADTIFVSIVHFCRSIWFFSHLTWWWFWQQQLLLISGSQFYRGNLRVFNIRVAQEVETPL